MTNLKGCGVNQLWRNLRFFPGICLEVLTKNTEISKTRVEHGTS
jgi:hypothetical protein